jgi:hypothetical protein
MDQHIAPLFMIMLRSTGNDIDTVYSINHSAIARAQLYLPQFGRISRDLLFAARYGNRVGLASGHLQGRLIFSLPSPHIYFYHAR